MNFDKTMLTSPLEFIQSEWQLISLFIVGLLVFAAIIGNPSAKAIVSAPLKIIKTEAKEEGLPPKTPGKKKIKSSASTPRTKTPRVKASDFGSVMSPMGRRSARVAKQSTEKKKRK